ncbi:uncharacterized protein LOC124144753 [Haliotis rufescens]|uniref:uncharacterized protein LOC124144753 n=1 Tax=Haliotis rufescens TaxID=6454 RepID=UPI00201F5098|nr:uncharacterized protein LOC124144753 [Haliotis rufescens]XP_048259915.1 uncharacterized protein LOC124144753 [Haliotis rufescens]
MMNQDEYGAKLFGFMGAGSAAIIIAMARETGILEKLLEAEVSMTSQEIAVKTGLKERYVREVLGALATAEVIQVSKDSSHYHVPSSHKSVLGSTSAFCRMMPHFGQRFPAVKECFKLDGPQGVAFGAIPEVFDIMDDYRSVSQDMFIDNILSAVPGLKEKLEAGITVAEFGSARGSLLANMAARFPKSSFTGSDVVADVVETANATASKRNLKNISFKVYDLYDLPKELTNSFDWIFISDVAHDLAYLDKALSEIRRAVKSGGTFSMLDICMHGSVAENVGNMGACFLFTGSTMLCLADSCRYENSAQLGPSWTSEKAQEYLRRAGFTVVKVHQNIKDKHMTHFVCE